jgi:hypothetical protein
MQENKNASFISKSVNISKDFGPPSSAAETPKAKQAPSNEFI